MIAEEYLRHDMLANSGSLNEYEREYFHKVAGQKADEVELSASLKNLSAMLDKHYGIPPVIIVDEYDTPIQQGHSAGFYNEVVLFMRNFFSGGLKDNKHLAFGFMTGILRIAKESIFSGLNNLVIDSVTDHKYSTYFGFTREEVREMALYYKAADKMEEIRDWYDGYRFGDTDIYNPWSVLNYFRNGNKPEVFWLSTGSNEPIGELLAQTDSSVYASLQRLMQGETIITAIDTNVIYPQIKGNPSSVFSFLLLAGYLKAVRVNAEYLCELAIPNREIFYVYRKEIIDRTIGMIYPQTALEIQMALYKGNCEELKAQLCRMLTQSVSFYDTAKESFYHGLMLGICAVMANRYEILSNREAGDGRFDICLKPRDVRLPGILIELKAASKAEGLERLAEDALGQICDRHYEEALADVKTVLKYGVAFGGKRVEIRME